MDINYKALNGFLLYLKNYLKGYMPQFLKDNFSIVDKDYAMYHQLKLEEDGYITTKPVAGGAMLCQLTNKGTLFILGGGYKEALAQKISENAFKNFVLNILKQENLPLEISRIAKRGGIDFDKNDLERIQKEMYRDRLVDFVEVPNFPSCIEITDLGRDSIKKAKTIRRLPAKKHVDKSSIKRESATKKEHPLKFIHNQLSKLFETLNDAPEGSVAFDNSHKQIINTIRLGLDYNAVSNFGKIRQEGISKSDLQGEVAIALTNIEFKIEHPNNSLAGVHPKIIEVAEKQFNSGHYREAVLNAYITIIEIVKHKHIIKDQSGKQKDGADLMQEVFSSTGKTFKFCDDPEERQGMMFLFTGAVKGLRNRYGHKIVEIEEEYALNLLHFASALLRLFENPKIY